MAKGVTTASIKVALEGDPSGFNRAAKSAEKSVKKLTDTFGVSVKQADDFVKNLAALDRVKAFDNINKKLASTKSQFVDAKQRARDLAAEYRRTGSAADKFASNSAKEKVKRLSAAVREQTALLRTESAALREVGISTGAAAAKGRELTAALDKQAAEWEAIRVAQKKALDAQIAKTIEAKKVQLAWGAIGKRSNKEVLAEIRRVTIAVNDLRSRGLLDQRAIDAARQKVIKLRRELGNVRTEQGKVSNSALSSMGKIDQLVSGLVSKWGVLLGGLSVGTLAKEIFQAGATAQAIESSFLVIAGGAAAASKEIGYVKKISKDLNIEFETSILAYRQLSAASKGTALEGQVTKDIFLGISQAATVLGLSADQTAGSLKAIEQMISKGKVQAEELRGQLGDRLPGALQMASKAMGVTTAELDKMLRAGEVTAELLLPRLAKFLQERFSTGAEAAASNAIQSINRLKNAWYDFRVELAEAGFLEFVTEKINNLSIALSDPAVRAAAVEMMQAFLSIAEAISKFVAKHGIMLAQLGGSVIALALVNKAVLTLIATWRGLNAVMLLTTGLQVIPLLRAIGGVAGAAIGTVAGLAGALAGLGAVWGTVQIYQAVQAFVEMREAQKMATEASKQAEAMQAKFEIRLQKISKESGVTVTSFKEMRAAFAEGAIAYDEATDTYSKGSGKIIEAAEASAAAVKELTKTQEKDLKEAEKKWKKYADKISDISKKIEEIGIVPTRKKDIGELDKIKGALKGIKSETDAAAQSAIKYGLGISAAADEMFELSLKGKTDAEVQRERVRAAGEYAAATRAAAAAARKMAIAGDIDGANRKWEQAVVIANKWKSAMQASAVEVKANWTPAMINSLDQAKESAKKFGKQYTKSMQEAKKAGEDLRKTTDDLAAAEKGLAAAQRDLARAGLTAAQVYQDVTAEQRDLERASKAAATAGNYDLAIAKAKEAQQVASELNQEVKEGEQTVVTAEQAKRNASFAEISARKLEIDALKAKKAAEQETAAAAEQAAAKAAAAKEKETAKIEALEKKKVEVLQTAAEGAEKAAAGIADANQAIVDVLDQQRLAVESLADSLNFEGGGSLGEYFTEAGKEAKEFGTLAEFSAGQMKAEYVSAAEAAIAKVKDLGISLDAVAKDRYVTIYVKEVQQKAAGGYIQKFARGGSPAFRRLSSAYINQGSGRRDDVPAMLMRREFVLKAAAVHNQQLGNDGVPLAYAHNRGDLSGMQAILSKHLGPPQIKLPNIPSALQGGSRTLILADPSTKQQAVVRGAAMDLQALEQMMRHRDLVSSR